jgi:hypothetical protein
MKPAPSPSPALAGTAGRWLWFTGVASLVFAARIREVHLFSSDTPILDQWDAEARQILVPWLQGKLTWHDFLAPHNEHVPLWTRLIAWLQAALLGRWDPQLQATFNAALHGVFAGTVAIWLRRNLPLAAAFALTLLLVTLAGLPFSWENSTWGFQSHTPLALLLVFLHIRGSFTCPPGTTRWWLAQAAGLAAFFTYGSMGAAPVAVLLTVLWTAAPGRRRWLSAALLGAAGIALVLYARAHQAPAHTLALTAHTPREFLADFLLQLGWPTEWPGACVVLCLPAFLLAFRIRRQREAENVDRITLALAVWAAAQAAAFAYARGGGYIGFVSRYGDLLALGVLANGVALWRLLQAAPGPRRWWLAALGVAWVVTLAWGLNRISTRGHTEYYQSHSEAWAHTRHEAVRQYLATKDIQSLSSDAVRAVLYPNPETVARSLDQPGLADLLPASLRPGPAAVRGDRVSAAAAGLRARWPGFAFAGGVLLLLGLSLGWKNSNAGADVLEEIRDPWLPRALGAVALGSVALLFLWPHPFAFSAEHRWLALLQPSGTEPNFSFHITTDTKLPKDNLVGGADLWPIEFRNHFFGTEIDGPGFVGIAESTPFTIHSPWLVIPFAGFPVSPGNGLRLRVEDAHGTLLDEIACLRPNPTDIDFWAVDVQAYPGCIARVIFYDGRDDAQGWVAAAPPQAVSGPEVAESHRRDRALEPTRFGQDALGVTAAASALLGLATFIAARRRKWAW